MAPDGNFWNWFQIPGVYKRSEAITADGRLLFRTPLPLVARAEYPRRYYMEFQLGDAAHALSAAGCQVALADGSVRSVPVNISVDAFSAAVTAVGGETLGLD